MVSLPFSVNHGNATGRSLDCRFSGFSEPLAKGFTIDRLRDDRRPPGQKQGLRCPVFLSHNPPMNYGYTRASKEEQDPALQLTALKLAGSERIFYSSTNSNPASAMPACSTSDSWPLSLKIWRTRSQTHW